MNGAGGGADQRWEGIFAIAVGTKRRREENGWRFSPLGFNPPDGVVLFGNNEGYCGPLDPLINVLSASQQNPTRSSQRIWIPFMQVFAYLCA